MAETYREALQTARLATQTTLAAAQAKYGDDSQQIRDELDAVIDGTTALPNEVLADFLTADFDADSGTTGATITATNLALGVAASTNYIVEATLFVTATTNGGIEIDFTYPSGATMVWQGEFHDAAATPLLVNDGENAQTGALNYIATALTFSRLTITGTLTVSTTAGTLTLRGAQNTGHADNTLIHAGSWLRLTPVV